MAYFAEAGYGVGERLPGIRPTAEALGLGAAVVRDAMREAQLRGWVEIRPRSGAYLLPRQSNRTVEACALLQEFLGSEELTPAGLIEARILIETAAVTEAARRRRPEEMPAIWQALENFRTSGYRRLRRLEADEAFHLALVRLGGNNTLVLLLELVFQLLRPYKLKMTANTGEEYRNSLRSHLAIYNYVLEGDAEGVEKELRRHMSGGLAEVKR